MFEGDQAAGLRALFDRQRPEVLIMVGAHARQASAAATLARAYAQQEISVLLLDGSAGEGARALGVAARYELGHVIAGDKDLTQVVHFAGPNLALLPARRGLEQLGSLEGARAVRLKRAFADWNWPTELLLVNARAGSGARVMSAFDGRARVVAVVSGEPSVLKAAYGEIKDLCSEVGVGECDVIVQGESDHASMRRAFDGLAGACRDFLDVRCRWREAAGRRLLGRVDDDADGQWMERRQWPTRPDVDESWIGESPYAAIG